MGITVEAPFRIKSDELSDTDRLCKKKKPSSLKACSHRLTGEKPWISEKKGYMLQRDGVLAVSLRRFRLMGAPLTAVPPPPSLGATHFFSALSLRYTSVNHGS